MQTASKCAFMTRSGGGDAEPGHRVDEGGSSPRER